MATPDSTNWIRRRSGQLRSVVTGLGAVLTALLVLERFSEATMRGRRGGGWDWLAAQAVAAGPEIAYLMALWWVRQTLSAFASGELFTPAVARTLDRVGLTLAVGAGLNTFVVPAAQAALGHGPGYWIAYDVGGLVLGTVGLSLFMVARLFTHASSVQAELDEIF